MWKQPLNSTPRAFNSTPRAFEVCSILESDWMLEFIFTTFLLIYF